MRAYLVGFVLSLVGIACGEPAKRPAGPTTQASASSTRLITPRERLPEPIQPLLPQRGYYAAGGGAVSSAWRVIVDRDAKTITSGTAAGPNAQSFGKLDNESQKALSKRNDELLSQLAEAAWREAPAGDRAPATADYDEILIFVDGPHAYFLQGFGPIKQPAAAKAIEELRAAAGL